MELVNTPFLRQIMTTNVRYSQVTGVIQDVKIIKAITKIDYQAGNQIKYRQMQAHTNTRAHT